MSNSAELEHGDLTAALIAEGPGDTTGEPARIRGGWCATGIDNSALLLDEALQVVARFAPPDGVDLTGESDDEEIFRGHQSAVSGDGRWAAFAGFGHIAVVGVKGEIVWQTRHPHMRDAWFETFPGAVVFPADRDRLWAFVPVQGDNDEDDGAEHLERWVVDLAEDRVLSRINAGYFEPGLVIHSGGRILGSGSSDGHTQHGGWERWTDSDAEMIATVDAIPVDVHQDQNRWLAAEFGRPVIGRFDGGDLIRFYDVMDEDDPFQYGAGCFVSEHHVLVPRQQQHEIEHALLDLGTLQVAGRMHYPAPFTADQRGGVVGGQDGTWVTTGKGQPLRRWRVTAR
ncbi:hypothetical protein [Actinomadura sp. B10D3]|uniref:hypothetical protein n=1 Tax=Actinomadura sp. B10D3 TaxID=3153557 RepID=UPI00325EFA80